MRISINTEVIERNQTKVWGLKSTITKLKNSLKGVNSKSEQAKEIIIKLEDRPTEMIESEEKREQNRAKK